jgi:hypothetical protein
MSDDKTLTIQAGDNERAVATTANKPAHDEQQPVSRHDGDVETKKPRRRKGVKQTTNTCSTSPRAIRIAERRAQALELRTHGHSFRQIGRELGISTAQAAVDVERALAEITREPAKELIKLELQRCDELMSAHYANACDGDVTATNTVLRVMAHRAMLMGWSRDQQGAARVVIGDSTGVDGANRRLELEFVLPGKRIADMADLDANPPQPSYSPSPVSRPVSSSPPRPRFIDGVVNPPTSVPIVGQPRKPGSWMD